MPTPLEKSPVLECVHHLFETQVYQTPDSVAVINEDEQLTFAQLNKRANQLARYLRRRGVHTEVRVGVCLERGVSLIISLLAIFKSGGAYVPLDPSYPKERLASMVVDAEIFLHLTSRNAQQALPPNSGTVINLQEISLLHESPENLQSWTSPQNLAYVLYTSGSTGHPKGVMISQKNVVTFLHWVRSTFDSKDLAGVLAGTSINFDLSIFELFGPLCWGGTVILTEDVLQLPKLPAIDRVTLINTVPSAMKVLLDQVTPSTVPIVNLAGELLTTELVASIFHHWEVKNVYDLYGPSEATTYSTYAIRTQIGPATIGKALTSTSTNILDQTGNRTPLGEAGELYIGGPQVARGYQQRAGLTAERFVPDPFGAEPGARLYRTGDRVRHQCMGNLQFLGRLDQQVKVRGFRIELGEIEVTLRKQRKIRDAVVVVQEHEEDEKHLVAFIISGQELPPNVSKLQQSLRETLPEYMVPTYYAFIENFPLTPNGKIDRKALPAVAMNRTNLRTSYVPPRTEQEHLLAKIWCKTLKIDQVGVHDNFFELGGHSLSAIRLISLVHQLWKINISLKDFFDKPTVGGLGEKLTNNQKNEGKVALPLLQAVSRSTPLPLSFSQQQLWLVDQLDPTNTAYALPYAWRLTGPLREEILERGLNALIERHEILRMHVVEYEGEPCQMFLLELPLTLSVVDLQKIPQSEQEQACQARILETEAQPFDLKRGPLIRAALYRLAPEDHVLILTLHHMVTDGWSMDILFNELCHFYEALLDGQPLTLPRLPIQYGDFAVWQRACLNEDVVRNLLTYWRTCLADAPANLLLPTDYPRPTIQTFRGENITRQLPSERLQSLKSCCQAEGVTLFMTFLAVLQILLARHSGQEDILIGTPVAYRNRVELEGIVGLFLNTLVLRTDLSGGPTFRELLTRVRKVCLDAYAHQELPFEQLVAALLPRRDVGRTPFFQVFLNLVDVTNRQLKLPGLSLKTFSNPEENSAKFDLTLYVFVENDRIWLTINYNSDLFNRVTIDWLFDHYETLLKGCLENQDIPVSAVSLFGDADRPFPHSTPSVLIPSPSSFSSFLEVDEKLTIPKRFEKMVADYPQQMAIHTSETRWTYAQLNRQANRIAHTLLHIFPNQTTPVPVGLLCTPGAPMFAALLGVLKTGNPYVPLEPTLPMRRLETIAADANITIVLCTPDIREQALLLEQLGYQIIFLNDQSLAQKETNVPFLNGPDSLAYILYTSGTTGIPKGVLQTHRNVLQHIRIYTNTLKIRRQDHLTLFSSFSFDAAVMDIFGALLNGATLYPLNLQETDPGEVSTWLATQAITLYHSTPTVYRYWIKHLKPGTTFPALRVVVLGGEEATREDFDAYRKYFGQDCFFVNGLGPTESTISLQFIARHDSKFLGPSVPVGFPVADTEVILLDTAGQKTEIYGEITLQSRHLALGYWQQPEWTQRAFSGPAYPGGIRQYRTGDLGRYRPDGTLEFKGRKDTQIKLRGYRIELGEIEDQLRKLPVIQQAVVLFQNDPPSQEQLVGYIVPVRDMPLDVSALRTALHIQLPEYMVPRVFVSLDALPFTPNGKIDRKALLNLTPTTVALESYVAPSTANEIQLTKIWEHVFGREGIGVHDNFFELGGHSLLAIQMLGQIRSCLKLDLSMRSLFEGPTISQLARLVKEKHVGTTPYLGRSLEPQQSTNHLRLSFGQQRLWFLDQFETGSSAYLLPRAYRLCGPLDREALHASLNFLVSRHESLRTTFLIEGNSPIQIIAAELKIPLTIVDLQNLSLREQDRGIHEHVQHEASRRFDLATGPLIRVTLLALGLEDHIILLTLHHIITDGWSNGILLRELGTSYRAFCQKRPLDLPQLQFQYADYCVWQQQWIESIQHEKHIAYWTEQLHELPILALPTDRPRPHQQTFSGGRHTFLLAESLVERLKQLSQQERCTLFMILLAAFQTLLHRYTGQEDIVVGSPTAGRAQPELEGVVGLFINTLVLRTKFSDDLSFQKVLQQVCKITLEAYAHEMIPFEQLLSTIKLERDMSYAPLFQVLFVLQNHPQADLELTGLTVIPLDTDHADGMLDLSLDLIEGANGLTGKLTYNTDLFDHSTIQRMSGHFETLLHGLVQNPTQSVSELPLLTKTERHQLLVEWNATTKPYPGNQPIHELVEAQVELTPHHVAVVCDGHTLTYQDLNHKANQLAYQLQEQGMGPGHFVPVLMERGLNLVIAYLAIMKTGAAFSPLDPDWPQERITEILHQLHAPVVLVGTHSIIYPELNNCSFLVVDVNQLLTPRENLHIPMTIDDPIYVIFTSGSTGKPKGAINHHRGIVNRFFNMNDRYHCRQQDVILLTAHHIFDSSVWQIFWPLINGARTIIPRPSQGFDLAHLVDLIDQEQVTIADFVPSVFTILLDYVTTNPHASQSLRSLRQLIIGGEAMQADPIWAFMSMFPRIGVSNAYGPTETSIGVIFFEVYKNCPDPIPIGRPLHNVYAVILDSHLQPVPIGIPGDLYIGGVCVGLGYLQNPEATMKVFIPNPFTELNGPTLYKTGDKAKFLPDGNIQFLGRIDHQVKIRGIRIELGEIERALAAHPEVKDCVVLAQGSQAEGKYLVGYIIPRQNAHLTPGDLQDFLKKKLPHSMIPSSLLLLESFPLTSGGKLNFQALPIPSPTQRLETMSYVPPRTSLETQLATIWQELLKVPHVGIHDNFFELGGHSLLATQVLSRVRTLTTTEVSLRTLFDGPTIAQLAKTLETQTSPMDAVHAPPLCRQPHEGPLPLSFAQQRLWFLAQLEPESPAYLMPYAWRLRGALDRTALEAGLTLLVARQASLRTSFPTIHEQPVQVIAPITPFVLAYRDLSQLSELAQEQEVLRLLDHERQHPMDLTTGPLWRAQLLALGPEEHVFLLTLHHIITDGWSMLLFFRELHALYTEQVTHQALPLAPLPVQYTDYACWQRQWLVGDVLDRQLTYWHTQLAGAPASLELPIARPRPPRQTFRGANHTFTLPASLTHAIQQRSQQAGVTVFMTLLATFSVLLFRYTGQRDLLIGTPISGRTHTEVEDLMGFFVNTLVLRLQVTGQPTFLDVLRLVRATCLEAYAHQDVPFEKLVEVLKPVRDPSRHPLFQVMFQLHHAEPHGGLRLPSLEVTSLAPDTASARFDLWLGFVLQEGTLTGTLTFNTDLFEASTIAAFVGHYHTLLTGLVTDSTRAITQQPLLTEAERQQVLIEWNPAPPPSSPFTSLQELFEEQVARTPEAIALIAETEHLTYTHLNQRANQLAHYLRRAGVGPEVRVGVCLERSLDLLVSLWAILKADGVYVPLDPQYPPARLAFMLEDARVACIVTTAQVQETALPAEASRMIVLDTLAAHLRVESSVTPPRHSHPHQLAYLIYTSGSSGRPKGVMVAQHGLANIAREQQRHFHSGPPSRVLLFASISFDASLAEIIMALTVGGTLILESQDALRPGLPLLTTLRQHAITLVTFPPSLLTVMPPEDLPALTTLLVAGEHCPDIIIQTWSPGRRLLNLYGPTEATIWSTTATFHGPEPLPTSLGQPIAQITLYLLDAHGAPVPLGLPGEAALGGIGLARGYLHHPALTAHQFVPDPFSPTPGARLYKTGDQVRYLGAQRLGYLGRLDHQVKVRGYRIEVGEIEGRLRERSGVQEVVVVCREDTPGEKQLVAYVVVTPQSRLRAAAMREALQTLLPAYMIPTAFVVLDQLPLTPNGKIDRRALPAPDQTHRVQAATFTTPRTLMEELVATVWQEVLHVEKVSIHDNFFDLGGHSLLATQLIARLNQQIQIDLPLYTVFDHPILANQAHIIEELLLQEMIVQPDSELK